MGFFSLKWSRDKCGHPTVEYFLYIARMRITLLFVLIQTLGLSQSELITLFENTNFDGISKKFYSTEEVKALQTWEDRVSSVKIAKGYQLTIFENKNFYGKSLTLTADLAYLKKINFNDKISSIIIEEYNQNSDAAVVYDNSDYNGLMFPLKVGGYSNLSKQSWLNDKITSVKINQGYQLIVYEHGDFKGKNTKITESQANLKSLKWNDKISSIQVERLSKESMVENKNEFKDSKVYVYVESYFAGKYKAYNATKVNKLVEFNDQFSSIRVNNDYQVTIYEHSDFKGKNVTITESLANLKMIKWNDKISSLIVEKYDSTSNVAILYEDSHFSGYFLPLKPGEHKNLSKQTWFNDKASSIKVGEGYKMTVFKDSNFKGKKAVLYNNQTSLKSIKLNDDISSLIIEKIQPEELIKNNTNPEELNRSIAEIAAKVDSVLKRFADVEFSSSYDKKTLKFGNRSSKQGNYSGLLKDGFPEDIGKFVANNGTEYIGEFKQGIPDGIGRLKKSDETMVMGIFSVVKGETKCLLGKGQVKKKDNMFYGNIQNDKFFGSVKIIHTSGQVFEGNFINEILRSGKGTINFGDMTLTGEFVDGQGLVKMKTDDFEFYGEILYTKKKNFNGYGIMVYKNKILPGSFSNGKLKKQLSIDEVKNVLSEKYKIFDQEILGSMIK